MILILEICLKKFNYLKKLFLINNLNNIEKKKKFDKSGDNNLDFNEFM